MNLYFTVFLTAHKWVHFSSMIFFFREENNYLNNPTLDWSCKTIQKETFRASSGFGNEKCLKTEKHQTSL